jgi:hypothetical protein
MSRTLRTVFYPFFLSQEIRTIIICLRLKQARDPGAGIAEALSDSLLADEIKKLFLAGDDLPSALDGLEHVLAVIGNAPHGFRELSEAEGLSAVEVTIGDRLIQHCLQSAFNPVVRSVIESLIDMRNIITLWKHLRWSIASPLHLQEGGRLSRSLMAALERKGDRDSTALLIEDFTGQHLPDPPPQCIESILYAGLSRQLQRGCRRGDDTALVLSCLWESAMECRNLGMLHRVRDSEREAFRKELVLT